MTEEKCPFCERGIAWRTIAWRIVKDMSRSEMQELLNQRKFKKRLKK